MPIVFSKLSGKNDPTYGEFESLIKAIIENESNALEKKKSLLDVLYNIERTSEKGIENIPYCKEFTITKETMDDAGGELGAEMESRAREFVHAYYKTRTKLAAWALANGTSSEGEFDKTFVNLTVDDGLPLFHNAHKCAEEDKTRTQSNFFYGEGICKDTTALEKSLNILANCMRNFKDEDGETMNYVPDVVILPCNRPDLEANIKKVIGFKRTAGTDCNDIIQYGNWTLVVLSGWETADDRFMLMSSEANKDLLGSMFYNRVDLDICNYVDEHTRSFVWNGYCRFGIGFTTWKHMLLAVDGASVNGATKLFA